jgi:hypothetical protein
MTEITPMLQSILSFWSTLVAFISQTINNLTYCITWMTSLLYIVTWYLWLMAAVTLFCLNFVNFCNFVNAPFRREHLSWHIGPLVVSCTKL